MRKNLLRSMLALALLSFGSVNVAAEEENDLPVLPVKMTYVSGTDADVDVAYGECDTIKAGWNLGNAVAVGSTISFGNKNWGANWIGVLKVDGTAIPGTITKATLKAKVSGSLDSKRNTGWGVALTDNEWSADLTYSTVGSWTVSAMLNGGVQVWTTSKSATGFEDISLDITDAFSSGQSSATLLVYEGVKDGNGGAAGGYMTEAYVEVEYDPFEATVTKFDFEDGTNIFTNDSRIASAVENDEVLNSKVTVFTAADNCQNGYGFAHYDFTDKLNQPALVKIEFDYYNKAGARAILSIGDREVRGNDGGCSKNTYGSKGAVFRIGSDKSNAFINNIILSQADVTTDIVAPVVDPETGEAVIDPETGEPKTEVIGTNTVQGLCDRWLHVALMINNDARTVTWVVTDQKGESIHYGSSAFYSDDANAASQIDVFAWINGAMSGKIDNLEITNYKSNAVFADYTIKYVDADGNEIKESRTGNGQVGKFVKLLDSDKEAIRTDNMKYIYDSDDSETVAIAAEGTVITVKFREAEKYIAVLNCKAGSETLKQFRDPDKYWFWEGDTYTIYPSRGYKAEDGSYWFTDANAGYNCASYDFPGALTPLPNGGKTYYIGTLNYEKDETVAYFANLEDLALPTEDAGNGVGLGQLVGSVNSWYSFSGGYFSRFDGGRGIRLDNGSYVYTEPIAADGTYMVRLYGRNDRSANCENPYALGVRDANGNVTLFDVKVPDWGSATTGTNIVGAAAAEATEETAAVEAAGIGIKAGESLVIINTGNGSMISLDDVILTKVADYAETATKAPAYTVAGCYDIEGEETAAFFGAKWDASQNDMTANEDGTYSKKFENVTFEQPGTIFYKVAVNHGWVESYGFDGNNADYKVNVPCTADVIFTFNPETKQVSCDVVGTYTATFINTLDWETVYVWAWNGDYNMYEQWPGVPATKTEQQVDGHDVYTWSYTGSVAPANIIFNNGGYGSGQQTADLEFVNGGFYNADGITTAISSVTTAAMNNVIYNLNGQKVMNAQKGLYIINGKKIVVK